MDYRKKKAKHLIDESPLLPARRSFIKRGLAAGGLAVSGLAVAGNSSSPAKRKDAGSSLSMPGEPFSNYGQPSVYEKHVIRWISANNMVSANGVSWTPLHDLEGFITPNPLHFERHHNGVPQIDPEHHQLLVDGRVRQPLLFSLDALKRYPVVSRLCFIECGGNSAAAWNRQPIQSRAGHFHGLVSCSEWSGVPLVTLLSEAGVDPGSRWLVAEGADAAGVSVSLPLDRIIDRAIVAIYQNGERIRPENGYPLRLLVPGWEGIVNVKWLRRLKLTSEPLMSRYETAKYTDLLPDGKSRQFSFLMQVKSLITRPSPGLDLQGPGYCEISGLAWSGAGRISRVQVSVDGGESWMEAQLQQPILPACLTRFRLPWHWDGKAAVLVSRAFDDQGGTQPSRQALLESRGEFNNYHYNALVSWHIAPSGRIQHVYL